MPEYKNRLISILVAGVILAPCCSYAILGDAPAIPLLAAIPVMIAIVLRRAVLISKRSVIYSFTSAFLITVILNELYPVDGDRFFIPMPTELLFPFVTTMAVCLAFFIQTPLILSAILALSAFAMMLHGSCVADPINTRFIVQSELWSNRYWVFGFFLVLQMGFFLPLLNYAQERKTRIAATQVPESRLRAFRVGAVVCLVVATIGVCRLAIQVEHLMEPVFNSIFRSYAGRWYYKVVFDKEVDLYRKSNPFVQQYEDRVVLRAKSRTPPGYLRGRVYAAYHDGTWAGLRGETVSSLPIVEGDPDLSTHRFAREGTEAMRKAESQVAIDLFPARFFYSDVLLASGSSQTLELIAASVTSDQDGVLAPREWDRHGGYTLINPDARQTSAYARPDLSVAIGVTPTLLTPKPEEVNSVGVTPQALESYLTLGAPEFEQALRAVADNIFAGAPAAAVGKMRFLESYLRDSYTYKLGVESSRRVDPVLQFLNESKSGHCELFASAAALLLRTQGIPTRYVTGFICAEPHPDQNYWIARLGDCHAWVEAWSTEMNQWVMLEPTPAIGVPVGEKRVHWSSRLVEYLVVVWKDAYADAKRGYFAESVIAVITGGLRLCKWLFWTGPWYFSWTITGILAMAIGRWFWRLRYAGQSDVRGHGRELRAIYRRIESYLRRLRLTRTATTSIQDLIRELRRRENPQATELCAVLTEYEALRFCPTPPDRERVQALARRVSKDLR